MSQKGKKNNEIKLFGYLLLDILDLEDLVCLVVFPSSEIVISDQRFRDLRPTAPQTSCFWCDRESLRNQGSCYCIAEKKLYILSFFFYIMKNNPRRAEQCSQYTGELRKSTCCAVMKTQHRQAAFLVYI